MKDMLSASHFRQCSSGSEGLVGSAVILCNVRPNDRKAGYAIPTWRASPKYEMNGAEGRERPRLGTVFVHLGLL
ncbi:hypothetical protein M407DRAFT_147552 [Tulasnella calospora MUT 4182]|uniref:Uncharacterized protein n=1 Tax=Tulasnella calospora MUT 4182 TaxID=1051891 RepID=A0A0C3MAJ2_9AGAM|nr:hypothetical protein M407DRAFT_147552 [Tulasnella calospora MUT 4182]